MSFFSTYTGAEVEALLQRVAVGCGVPGTIDLTPDVSEGVVSGLELPFVPTKALFTLEVPEDSLDVVSFNAVLFGPPVPDGFSYVLTGFPDRAGYRLHYLLLP